MYFALGFVGFLYDQQSIQPPKSPAQKVLLCSWTLSSLLLPRFTFSPILSLLAASRALWLVHGCPSLLRDELGSSCSWFGISLRGVKSVWPALPGLTGCSPVLCVAGPRGSWFFRAFLFFFSVCVFFFFADGIGDVLSHLRKQVEILFNTRYGKIVIKLTHVHHAKCWPLPWGAPNCSQMSPTISKPAAE